MAKRKTSKQIAASKRNIKIAQAAAKRGVKKIRSQKTMSKDDKSWMRTNYKTARKSGKTKKESLLFARKMQKSTIALFGKKLI